jgi:phage replication O-like protein O
MVSPQVENGYTPIANELLDQLMKVNLSGSEWQLLIAILRKTYGFQKKTDWITLSQFAKITGIERRNVHRTLKKLSSKQMTVVQIDDNNRLKYGFNKNYEQWELSSKQTTHQKLSSKQTIKVSSKQTPTKESITKENIYINVFRELPSNFITEKWKEVLPELPQVRDWGDDRKKLFKDRCIQILKSKDLNPKHKNLAVWWEDFFNYIRTRPFLMGEVEPKQGYKRFYCRLPWLMNRKNFMKIIEGEL